MLMSCQRLCVSSELCFLCKYSCCFHLDISDCIFRVPASVIKVKSVDLAMTLMPLLDRHRDSAPIVKYTLACLPLIIVRQGGWDHTSQGIFQAILQFAVDHRPKVRVLIFGLFTCYFNYIFLFTGKYSSTGTAYLAVVFFPPGAQGGTEGGEYRAATGRQRGGETYRRLAAGAL